MSGVPIQGQEVSKVHPMVREAAGQSSTVEIFLLLKYQPQRAILQKHEQAYAFRGDFLERRYHQLSADRFSLPAAVRAAGEELEGVVLDIRRAAHTEIADALRAGQGTLEAKLLGLGATRIIRYSVLNLIAATIPSGALNEVASDAGVGAVYPVGRDQLQISTSVPALGVPAFWTAGQTGAGQSVAVIDSGVDSTHPALLGKVISPKVFLDSGKFDSCFADDATSSSDLAGHGTHVAGIIASQGSTDWLSYQGVAKGVTAIYNLKAGYKSSCSGGSTLSHTDVMAAINYAVLSTPVKVINFSAGSAAAHSENDSLSKFFDSIADTYGISFAVSAGNSGSGATTVSAPSTGYNVISVASIDIQGTSATADDTISSFSSRGPTTGGLNKPDIAAPGSSSGGSAGIYSSVIGWIGANP
ncbi:MAG: S8 family serine peptidase, partial [Bryobacteraceae bacterium]